MALREKRLEHTALFGLLVQVAFAGVAYALYVITGSLAMRAQAWFLVPGVLLWIVVMLHGRQRRRAQEEREELEELQRTRLSDELFDEQEVERMREHAGLVIFERYVVPGIAVVLSGLLAFFCYWSLRTALREAPDIGAIKDPLVGVGGLAGIAFFGLLVGKYCVALAQSTRFRLLRASGSFMLGNAASSFLVVCSLVMVQFGVGWLEAGMAFLLPGVMGLIAVEIVLSMVLDIYRPRVPGQEVRPHYDSRLLGLIAAPGSMLKTIAATLDYQFGFKVSETWFYRFMGRAIIPLFLVQIIALWLLSCLVIVHPDEIAFIEQFGKPILTKADAERGFQATVYTSGVRFKAPWPIQTARKVPAYRLFRKDIGKHRYKRGERGGRLPPGVMEMTDPNYLLWGEVHIEPSVGYEVSFLSPGSEEAGADTDAPPVNIAFLEAQVHYRVKRTPDGRGVDEKAAYRFYYDHRDPERLLENLAYAVLTRLAARQDFLEWMNVKRGEISEQFRDDLQKELHERGMGLEIVYAGIPVVYPPHETARAFEGVGSAYQEMEKLKHIGRGQAARIVGEARGEEARILGEASEFATRLSKVAGAESERFAIQAQTYRMAPRVYLHRLYLRALEDILRGHRVYVLPVRKDVGVDLDLTTTQPGITGGINLEENFR